MSSVIVLEFDHDNAADKEAVILTPPNGMTFDYYTDAKVWAPLVDKIVQAEWAMDHEEWEQEAPPLEMSVGGSWASWWSADIEYAGATLRPTMQLEAPTAYAELTDKQREWFKYMFDDLLIGSTYWADYVERKGDAWHFMDMEDGGTEHTITRDDVVAALAGNAGAWFHNHKRGYFQRFGECMATLDFANMDFDADVTDCLVQLIVFGDLVYG